MSLFMDKSFFSKKFFLLFTFLFLGYFSFSQIFPSDYVSRVLTTTDGLPGNTITDIIQSKDGYIYIGTYDGLVRYDGFDFTILNKNTVADFDCVSARSREGFALGAVRACEWLVAGLKAGNLSKGNVYTMTDLLV